MSRFLSEKYRALVPYDTTGEHDSGAYIRLNTNESPFPPSPRVLERVAEAAGTMNFYPDPDGRELTERVAALCGVESAEVLLTCGSDEALRFIFAAFCDETHPAAFPEITYSFYEILAGLYGVPFKRIPLNADLSLSVENCLGLGATLFLANPNSPTGSCLSRTEAERVIRGNPDSLVVMDEAYVDFGGESCVPLIHEYDNLLVVRTFSKSRSLAGARLGFCLGRADLIRDLKAIKDSAAPYNLSSTTLAAGLGALEDEDATRANCRAVIENRDFTAKGLKELGFTVLPSAGNFLLVRHPEIGGGELARRVKERGILIRHYNTPEALAPYCRITIGTGDQMESLLATLRNI
ncbi:MAG: histidinol-phosphate transaminase [Synergistaceae bacterium]|nr:histidinol-phosphate transaminase [Synergistaceae bacterium]